MRASCDFRFDAGSFPFVPCRAVEPGRYHFVAQRDRKVVIHATEGNGVRKIEGQAATRLVADFRRACEAEIAKAIFGHEKGRAGLQSPDAVTKAVADGSTTQDANEGIGQAIAAAVAKERRRQKEPQ
jgi:hypothetical protein